MSARNRESVLRLTEAEWEAVKDAVALAECDWEEHDTPEARRRIKALDRAFVKVSRLRPLGAGQVRSQS